MSRGLGDVYKRQESETVEMATDEEGARLGCQLVITGDITVRAAEV